MARVPIREVDTGDEPDPFDRIVRTYEALDPRDLDPDAKRKAAREAVLAAYGDEDTVRDLFTPPDDAPTTAEDFEALGLSETAAKVAATRPEGSNPSGLSDHAEKILGTRYH